MTIWLIEPHDPLIFRDGRPFGPTPGARARSLAFPFPSTIAGGVRSQAGLDNSDDVFRLIPKLYTGPDRVAIQQELDQLTKLPIRGPLLVQLPNEGLDITPAQWMVSAPKDALILSTDLKAEDYGQVQQLLPIELPPDARYDLQQHSQELLLVGQTQPDPGKPHSHAPLYWTWSSIQRWLLEPEHFQKQPYQLDKLGHSGPEREQRVHVGMDFQTRAGKPEALFDTSGLEFTYNDRHKGNHLDKAQALGLLVMVDENKEEGDATKSPFQMRPGVGCLGSERRIVNWRRSICDEPECPDDVIQCIIDEKACRLLLLTPAYFEAGYLPHWATTIQDDVQPKLKAIAIDRPQVVSGWDLANNRPKATRRLAPAGTVLFLAFADDTPKSAIRAWIKRTWLHCISDTQQDRTDGFGLAILGTWFPKEGQKA